MHLVDLVMEQLLIHHICSRTFRNLLHEYLDIKTDHFVHEFYSFMRSPFDMIGYDRNVIYTNRWVFYNICKKCSRIKTLIEILFLN